MSDSIKTQIIKRIMEICQPLIAEQKFRKIERKTTLFLLEPVKPSMHLVIGDETGVVQDERGYTATFPLMLKLIMDDARDPYALADESSAFVQRQIETDEQLGGLASKITYDGELPFTEEALKPSGGTVLMYVVEYRRLRGDPTTAY